MTVRAAYSGREQCLPFEEGRYESSYYREYDTSEKRQDKRPEHPDFADSEARHGEQAEEHRNKERADAEQPCEKKISPLVAQLAADIVRTDIRLPEFRIGN